MLKCCFNPGKLLFETTILGGYMYRQPYGRSYSRRGTGIPIRLLIALVIAGISFFSYLGSRSKNEVTGETQYVDMTPEQEIAMGLQAAPQMAQQYGGLYQNQQAQDFVKRIGQKVVANSVASQTPYSFDFHLLADEQTVNAFALPGGQIFITAALLDRLETEAQLAGVLGHEVGHVVGRHSSEHLAKQKLTQGLTGAVGVAAGDYNTARMAQMVGQMINMQYGRNDELESDKLGVKFMTDAGYDPQSLMRVMEILEEASGGARQPEFMSSHPNPGNRIEHIQQAIQEYYPNGLPEGLTP
jgi:beta-barrel assembly-enhancing protease